MQNGIKCMNCGNFDRCDGFRSSNLRRCSADGRLHWKGDDAEECILFTFTKEDLR